MKYSSKFILALCLSLFFGSMSAQVEFYGKDLPETLKETKLAVVMSGSESYQAELKQAVENYWKLSEFEFIDEQTFDNYKSDSDYSFLYVQMGEVNGYPTDFFTLAIGNKKKSEQPLILKELIVDKKKISGEGSPMVRLYVQHIQRYIKAVEEGTITDETFSGRWVSNETYRLKEMPLIVREKDFDSTLDTEEKRTTFFKGELVAADQERINNAILDEEEAGVVDVILTGERRNMYCYKRIYNAATGELLYSSDTESLYEKKQGLIQDDMKAIATAR